MELTFSQDDNENFISLTQNEWLETNGLGGHASSSLAGCNTRKYHGLLVVNNPEVSRKYVLVSKVDSDICCGQDIYNLGTNWYPNAIYPQGHKRIRSFENDLCPTLHFQEDQIGLHLEQSYLMINGSNTTIVKYKINSLNQDEVTLRCYPLITYRDIHSLTKENGQINNRGKITQDDILDMKLFHFRPYEGMPDLYISGDQEIELYPAPFWNKYVEYEEERKRGYEFQEDLLCPLMIEKKVKEGDQFYLVLSTEYPNEMGEEIWNQEIKRRENNRNKLQKCNNSHNDELFKLKENSQKFIINNHSNKKVIIAGYPWFNEWRREVLLSVPGLTFYCGRFDEGIEILKNYAEFMDEGKRPDYFANGVYGANFRAPEGALWYFWTIMELYKLKNDTEIIKKNFESILKNIIDSFIDGKNESVELKENNLLWLKSELSHLTWMNICVGDRPITPRSGFVVEFNILWGAALDFYLEIFGNYRNIKERLLGFKKSFKEIFWNEEQGFLSDYVDENEKDFSLRPNQILAMSFNYKIYGLSRCEGKRIIKNVKKELLTPYGPRSLAPSDQNYRGTYSGDPITRDYAYHQGSVWPSFLGHYIEAHLNVADNVVKALTFLQNYFTPLLNKHIYECGILSVSEIFDGQVPHYPRGETAQALSVAEVIRSFEILKSLRIKIRKRNGQ